MGRVDRDCISGASKNHRVAGMVRALQPKIHAPQSDRTGDRCISMLDFSTIANECDESH
jgi:hypothetical protein